MGAMIHGVLFKKMKRGRRKHLGVPVRYPHSKEGCIACPGYCCKRFYFSCCGSEDLFTDALKRANTRDQVRSARFAIRNFIPVKYDGIIGYNWYTCKKFDDKLGVCTYYALRPSLCRSFLCGSAGDPDADFVEKHFSERAEWGKRVKNRRLLKKKYAPKYRDTKKS